jgi:hypothetical protein
MGKFERGRQWPTLIRALSLPSFRFRLDPPRGSRAIAASMSLLGPNGAGKIKPRRTKSICRGLERAYFGSEAA